MWPSTARRTCPTSRRPALSIAGYLPRRIPATYWSCATDVRAASIATSSPRRRLQIRLQIPDAVFTEIRGNVDTRLKKVASGAADATILAAAGLKRLGHRVLAGAGIPPAGIRRDGARGGAGCDRAAVRTGTPRDSPRRSILRPGGSLAWRGHCRGGLAAAASSHSPRTRLPGRCISFTRRPASAAWRSRRGILRGRRRPLIVS